MSLYKIINASLLSKSTKGLNLWKLLKFTINGYINEIVDLKASY